MAVSRLVAARPSASRFLHRLARLAALLLLLGPTLAAHASVTREPIEVSDGWRFRWGDSPVDAEGVPAWAKETGDTKDWAPMKALQEPPGRGANTFLWLSLPVPAGDWAEPALFLGEVNSVIEVYARGRRIYTSGKLNPSGHEARESMGWHLMPLPREVLGGRVLLRIQSSDPTIGVGQHVQVGARHEVLASVLRAGQAPFVVGILLFVVALAACGAFALFSRRRMLVGLAAFAASGGMVLLGSSGLPTALWDAAQGAMRALMLGVFISLPGLTEFISDAILDRKLRWFRRASLVLCALCVPPTLTVFVDMDLAQRAVLLSVPVSLTVLVVCVAVAAVEAWRGNRDARLFGLGLAGLFLSVIITVLPILGVASTAGNVTHWGYLALTLSLVGIVARRTLGMVHALRAHTRELEDRQQEVRTLAERMGDGAGELAAVVQQLRTSSDEQAAGVSRQAVALQQAEQTVAEIRRTSHLTAEKASTLAASAGSAEQMGREGAAALERTLEDLAAIRSEVSEMARRILALDARTQEVSSIVDSVKTLADQSNMLAINAAIEAARSGESGKGFGVVARQMRGLADQSIQATHRIREVLDGVSASMREAARTSEQGDERVRKSVDAVRTSGAQLQRLTALIRDTSDSMRQITAAVTEQDAGTHQMAQAIQELSAQMKLTLTAVQQTQDATRSVHTLAESMSGLATETLRADAPGGPTPQAA